MQYVQYTDYILDVLDLFGTWLAKTFRQLSIKDLEFWAEKVTFWNTEILKIVEMMLSCLCGNCYPNSFNA